MSVDTSKECLLWNPKWQGGSLNLLFNMFTSYRAIQMTYFTLEDFLIVGFFWEISPFGLSCLSYQSCLYFCLIILLISIETAVISLNCAHLYMWFIFYVSLPRSLSILLIFSKNQHLIARVYLNGFLFVLHFIDFWS